ncbi:argininosuccinate lyase [Edaphobacter sp. HDX4]|uniref:argininosuccinate lyase n=1 Tax=Edaphobacter sp. HDX4 TaxID=2794064 RepID=UPI002FE62723
MNSSGQSSKFPAPIYRDTVLAPVFADAKRYFLDPLLEIEYAHTLMLARQGIMPAQEAAACIRAVDDLDRDEVRAAEYDGSFEDLFFYLEKKFAAACGEEVAGKMHTARSRNDIDLTMYRMVLRERLLQIVESLLGLRQLLLDLSWKHRDALMPAYTHNQPAQPTTLGHYLLAYIEILERDTERVRESYVRVNRNPLGACAITTTGFPIDREFTARLLGFDGLQLNSYGAIASVDYLIECCGVLVTAMLSMGRFTQDLLLWSTVEFGYLRLSDAYVQISSIMPQKRNPVPLEHVRILASRALFEAQGVVGSLHNTPFADMNDAEDDLQPLVYTAFDDADRSIRLLQGALGDADFNTERMAKAADGNFLPVTELADTLVRATGMSFHTAHSIVSRAVRELDGDYNADLMATIVERELQGKYALPHDRIRGALSARNFVAVRKIAGDRRRRHWSLRSFVHAQPLNSTRCGCRRESVRLLQHTS